MEASSSRARVITTVGLGERKGILLGGFRGASFGDHDCASIGTLVAARYAESAAY